MKPPVRAYASSEATQGWTAGFRAVAKRLDVRSNRAGCTRALAAAKRMHNL
jgi:hypothetical protein